jgi:MFS family permease
MPEDDTNMVSGMRALRARRGSLPLLAALAIDALGSGLFLPISLLYFSKVSDIELSLVGIVLSISAAATLPLPVWVGQLVDRFGAYRIVIAAQVLQAVGFFGYLIVSGPFSLALAALIVTAGQRAFWSSAFTLIVDFTSSPGPPLDAHGKQGPGDGQDQWFAVVGMLQAAGHGLGGFITGSLLTAASETVWRLLVSVNATTFVVAALLLLFGVRTHVSTPAKKGPHGGYRLLLADRPYQALILVNSLFALCSVFLGLALPVYLIEGVPTAPHWLVGPLLALNTVLLATGQTLAVRLVRPLPRGRALACAGALWVVWSVAMAAAIDIPATVIVPYLVIVTMLYTLAELVHAPLSNTLAAAAAPRESRGRYLAVFQYSFMLAKIVAPGLFTVLFTRSPVLPWIVIGTLVGVGSLGMLALERRLPAHAVHRERDRDESLASAK